MEEKKHDNKTAHQQAKPSVKREEAGWGWRMAVNLCRLPLSLALIFSGFVKAIDPLGTQYKIGDYLEALHLEQYAPSWATLTTSVLLSAVEFCLGVFLLFAIRRRKVGRVIVAFMAIMTAITVWLWGWEPIKDCGCFGDAIHLTNGETLLKNLLLLAMAAVVAWKPFCMVRFISKTNQWIVINYTLLFILVSSALSLWYLPPFDFRPYHIGADIRKGMEIPAGAKQPKFETTFILEKGGVRKEFTLDNYPDSTWTFIDSKTVEVEKGYEPPIHDFSITDPATDDDLTEQVLADKGYTFVLVAPYLGRRHQFRRDRPHLRIRAGPPLRLHRPDGKRGQGRGPLARHHWRRIPVLHHRRDNAQDRHTEQPRAAAAAPRRGHQQVEPQRAAHRRGARQTFGEKRPGQDASRRGLPARDADRAVLRAAALRPDTGRPHLAVDEVGPTEEKAKQHAIGSGARAVAARPTGLRHKARPTFLHEISQSI